MNFRSTLTAIALAAITFTSRAQAAPLLDQGVDNHLNFADSENLYDSKGNYVKGNAPAKVGQFLVGIFEITANQTNGWLQNPSQNAARDTYYGVFVEKVSSVTAKGGVTTIGLTPAAVGDPTTFTGGGGNNPTGKKFTADKSSFSTLGVLNYANGDQFAVYHQGAAQGALPLFASAQNGTVGAQFGIATEGVQYLTLNNTGTTNPAANSGANGNYYSFSSGTVPPNPSFSLTNFSGVYIDVNNTGFGSFDQIADSNVAGGTLPVSVFLESKVNFNTNGQFNGNKSGKFTSSWDFQSADPVDLQPAAVPEPASAILLALGGAGIVAVRRRRAKKVAV